MKLRKTQLSYRLKKMNGNARKDGKIWNTGVALLKYFAGLNSNQNGQYGQIYAEKFTSACLIWGILLMAEKKKILYIVEAMGGGVFTYIVDINQNV